MFNTVNTDINLRGDGRQQYLDLVCRMSIRRCMGDELALLQPLGSINENGDLSVGVVPCADLGHPSTNVISEGSVLDCARVDGRAWQAQGTMPTVELVDGRAGQAQGTAPTIVGDYRHALP